jgi:F1F0 ATPase subunit 2
MGNADMLSSTEIAIYAAAGAALAGLYFGTLWLTVARLPSVRAPLILLFVSTAMRLALLLVAFALVTGMEWTRLAVCFAGFFAVRLLTIAWLRPALQQPRREPT